MTEHNVLLKEMLVLDSMFTIIIVMNLAWEPVRSNNISHPETCCKEHVPSNSSCTDVISECVAWERIQWNF